MLSLRAARRTVGISGRNIRVASLIGAFPAPGWAAPPRLHTHTAPHPHARLEPPAGVSVEGGEKRTRNSEWNEHDRKGRRRGEGRGQGGGPRGVCLRVPAAPPRRAPQQAICAKRVAARQGSGGVGRRRGGGYTRGGVQGYYRAMGSMRGSAAPIDRREEMPTRKVASAPEAPVPARAATGRRRRARAREAPPERQLTARLFSCGATCARRGGLTRWGKTCAKHPSSRSSSFSSPALPSTALLALQCCRVQSLSILGVGCSPSPCTLARCAARGFYGGFNCASRVAVPLCVQPLSTIGACCSPSPCALARALPGFYAGVNRASRVAVLPRAVAVYPRRRLCVLRRRLCPRSMRCQASKCWCQLRSRVAVLPCAVAVYPRRRLLSVAVCSRSMRRQASMLASTALRDAPGVLARWPRPPRLGNNFNLRLRWGTPS